MRRNALIHHKRNLQNNFLNSKLHSQIKDSIIENPENSAKFCLLQISQQAQRSNNRTFSSFQIHHLRSFSTELFTQKKTLIEKQKVLNEEKNCVQSGRYRKQESQQSVALKSTFSNDMRKITQIHLLKKNEELPIQIKSQRYRDSNSRQKTMTKFRKVNYLPLVVPQKQIEKIDEIFNHTPSRQILAILKRANIVKEIQQNDKELIQKEHSQEKFPVRKKSIFSIRHLMMKQKNPIDSARKEKESPELRGEISQCFQLKEHRSNNYEVAKLRLRNRRNFSVLETK